VSISRAGLIPFFLGIASPASAAQYLVEADGTFNNYSATLFGDASLQLPFQVSFEVQSDEGTAVPSGTLLYDDDGYHGPSYLDLPALAFLTSDISNFSLSLGGSSFDKQDLVAQGLGSIPTFNVLLVGDLDSLSRIVFTLVNPSDGEVWFGGPVCTSDPIPCQINFGGAAFSYQDGGFGEVSSMTLSTRVVGDGGVPEPSTWAMMLLGFGVVGGAMRGAKRKLTVTYA
jgi:hypothetical protein